MLKRVTIFMGSLQFFVAAAAIPAGLSMILEPNGSGVGISTTILAESPFSDFLIPGLFLFLVHGLLNIAGAFFSFRRRRYAGGFALGLGACLVLWIFVQIYFTGLIHFLQPLFLIIGIIEIILSFIFIRLINKVSE